ncbi:hypothetical protein ACFODZ_07700 [Marinicella sediminis]|uniref:Uncharacterized protein n=1 Tax=Marinicella sediminis TaxID=1792834 RepID=A0ABV7JDE5_9GAMM|nr:hypothetical protein [Marinicella sediminis]
MKTSALKSFVLLCLFAVFSGGQAVSINPDGTGEVLIYPYYTARNNFNTSYSIVNTTAEAKAIKVRFLEGHQGVWMLDFNVYLGPFDVWTGALIPTTSSLPPVTGEPSVMHLTNDLSCAPDLDKSGTEFLPDSLPAGADMERSTEGYLVVIEMGQVNGASAAAIQHDGTGTPNDCTSLETAWDNGGYWFNDPNVDLSAPTGGLTGSLSLLNIAEGLAMGHDAVALSAFWQGDGMHTNPGNFFPHLGNAFPQSTLVTDQGIESFNWINGYEAVSAVLMSESILNQYDLSPFLIAFSEWVLNFPTKRFHTASEFDVPAPFSNYGDDVCINAQLHVYDPNTLTLPEQSLLLCGTVGILEFLSMGDTPGSQTAFLGSALFDNAMTSSGGNDSNGWGRLSFAQGSQAMITNDDRLLTGLPVVGFQTNKYTNSNAQVGILATYAKLVPHSHSRSITDDLIFADDLD